MSRSPLLAFAFIATASITALGVILGARKRWSKVDTSGLDFSPFQGEQRELSMVLYWQYYVEPKGAVEVRFKDKVIYVDGDVFRGDDVKAELKRKRLEKGARYLVLIDDEFDRFGRTVSRIESLRDLGFAFVVVMLNRHYWDDSKTGEARWTP